MTKYNEFEIEFSGTQYVFVTRGKSKPFTAMEATDYLTGKVDTLLTFPNKPVVPHKDADFSMPIARTESDVAGRSGWQIPDDKMRRHMFQKDLQRGMKFCVGKYGQSKEVLEAEAKRLALGGF